MTVDPFPCPRQCIEQSCILQCLELTPRQHPLPDQFRVVVGAAELISEIHRVSQRQAVPVCRGGHLRGHSLNVGVCLRRPSQKCEICRSDHAQLNIWKVVLGRCEPYGCCPCIEGLHCLVREFVRPSLKADERSRCLVHKKQFWFW